MTGIKSYSTTAANNVAANTGINWDEGMSPAAVNNSARAVLADIRAGFNDLPWFSYGVGDEYVAGVYASATSFTYAGVDLTDIYKIGARVRAVGSSTGTIYGTISASVFSTNTTVTVKWDSGSLSNETLTISIAMADGESGTWTPTDQSGASLTFSAVSCAYSRIGNMVFAYGTLTFPVTSDGTQVLIGGLPLPVPNAEYARQGCLTYSNVPSPGFIGFAVPVVNSSTFSLYGIAGGPATNANMSGAQIRFNFVYPLS